MAVAFTSDPHFFHVKMADKRGYANVDAMNESLIYECNRVAPEGHDLYILGDVSFAGGSKTRSVLGELKARLHLIPGNHDKGMNEQTRSMFFRIHPQLYELNLGMHEEDGTTATHRIVLCHFPLLSWNRMHHGAIHLHGHCHNTARYPQPGNRIMDVGVDARAALGAGYAPITAEQMLGIMASRGFMPTDQHGVPR